MDRYAADIRALWLGLMLSLCTLMGGFVLGAVFGAGDRAVRGWLEEESRVAAAAAGPAAPSAEVRTDRAWKYLQRAHLHANGMGTSAVVLIALLPLTGAPEWAARMIAAALGLGAMGYAAFLLLAAWRTPALGEPAVVKESLKWIAMPSAGLYLAGAGCVTGLVARWARRASVRPTGGPAGGQTMIEQKPGRAGSGQQVRAGR